jgi:hypothetical protein
MDWELAIRRNREALLRVVAILFVMAGLNEDALSPSARSNHPPLPRFFIRPVRNSILRVLRPAESALRRLIIIAARGVTVAVPPARKAKHASKPNGTAARRPAQSRSRPRRAFTRQRAARQRWRGA